MKKIYLDWSHLQIVLDEGSNKYNKLISDNILCLSFAHLTDMARGSDKDKIIARARKLDSIQNKLFLRDADHLQVYEIVLALQNIVGLNIVSENVFAVDRLYKVLSIKDQFDKISLTKNDSISRFVEEVSFSKDGQNQIEKLWSGSVGLARTVSRDRKYVHSQKKMNDLQKMRVQKVKNQLFNFIGQAVFLLVLNGFNPKLF